MGEPTGWLADRLPLDEWAADALAVLSPDDDVGGGARLRAPRGARGRGARCPPVRRSRSIPSSWARTRPTPAAATPLLVTGDSLPMPLDVEMARRLAAKRSKVRDPHVGTGISKSDLLDWGKLSVQQVREREPDAVVVFIGANEGFPMPGAGGRERPVLRPGVGGGLRLPRPAHDAHLPPGRPARVYWLTLPFPRDADRQEIARAVNAAIEVAAQPYRAHVRLLDMAAIFTPGRRLPRRHGDRRAPRRSCASPMAST